jgi:hypothetical protein
MGQCARYEKFDLHLSPDVEDNLKLGIGIDVDKIGKTCGGRGSSSRSVLPLGTRYRKKEGSHSRCAWAVHKRLALRGKGGAGVRRGLHVSIGHDSV